MKGKKREEKIIEGEDDSLAVENRQEWGNRVVEERERQKKRKRERERMSLEKVTLAFNFRKL